jgi:hypothetical protein
MDVVFYSLQELYESAYMVTFIAMAVAFVGLLGFWRFLTSRDDDIDKF